MQKKMKEKEKLSDIENNKVTKVSAFLSGISLSTSRLNSLMKRH
jgi:hypothetical protein